MKYFLDTNVIIDALKGKSKNIRSHFENINSDEIYISSIVAAELEYGAAHSHDYEKNKNLYESFIANFEIISFDFLCREAYGSLRQELSSKGFIIGSNDMLIAATALTYGAILVTHNTREFERIPNLVLEDWF